MGRLQKAIEQQTRQTNPQNDRPSRKGVLARVNLHETDGEIGNTRGDNAAMLRALTALAEYDGFDQFTPVIAQQIAMRILRRPGHQHFIDETYARLGQDPDTVLTPVDLERDPELAHVLQLSRALDARDAQLAQNTDSYSGLFGGFRRRKNTLASYLNKITSPFQPRGLVIGEPDNNGIVWTH